MYYVSQLKTQDFFTEFTLESVTEILQKYTFNTL